MPKQVSDYTDAELIELGKKVVAQKNRDAEKAKVMARLYADFIAKQKKG